MNVKIISFTDAGFSLAERLRSLLQETASSDSEKKFFCEISVDSASSSSGKKTVSLSEWVKANFMTENAIIFIGAAGIAVRSIAPFVKDKRTDPAVIVLDEKGEFVIPLLSGHIGQANETARKIAALLDAQAVITTASDVNNLPAIDEFAKKNNLLINDMKKARTFAAQMLRGEKPAFSVSVYIKNDILNLIPRCVILGIGCKKGKNAEELENFVREVLDSHKIDYRSVGKVASIDLKKDENAIISLANAFSLPFVTFSADELNGISQKVSHSDFVSEITGTDNVCERAVYAAGADEMLVSKTAKNGMTVAVGMRQIEIEIPEKLKECMQ